MGLEIDRGFDFETGDYFVNSMKTGKGERHDMQGLEGAGEVKLRIVATLPTRAAYMHEKLIKYCDVFLFEHCDQFKRNTRNKQQQLNKVLSYNE